MTNESLQCSGRFKLAAADAVVEENFVRCYSFVHIPTKWKNLKEFECGKDAISKPEVST